MAYCNTRYAFCQYKQGNKIPSRHDIFRPRKQKKGAERAGRAFRVDIGKAQSPNTTSRSLIEES